MNDCSHYYTEIFLKDVKSESSHMSSVTISREDGFPMTKNPAGKFWSFAFYFLFYAGAVAIFNYFALYFQGQGLTGSQIGVLMGLASLIGLFTGPLWSGLADASQRHRLVLSIALIGNLIAIFLFPFSNSFWWFLLLIVIESFFGGPIISMADNATMTMLGDEREHYGRVRIGGTIGWGLAAPIIGAVVMRYGMRYNFSVYSIAALIALIVVQQMHFSKHQGEGSFWNGVRQLLTDGKWIAFLIIVFIAGSGNGIITSYLFVYLQKIGTSPAWMGWAVTISTAAEVPALFFAGRMLKKLGARGLLLLGLVCMALRCGLYGLVNVPWEALTVQLLQFVTFPILLVAGVSYAYENAPKGMGATAQSIFSSAFFGIGSAAGGFFGGVLMQYIGVQNMFLTFGLGLLLAAATFGLLQRRELANQPA
jgi:PPP family 3-phenylpropionic acid transporter